MEWEDVNALGERVQTVSTQDIKALLDRAMVSRVGDLAGTWEN